MFPQRSILAKDSGVAAIALENAGSTATATIVASLANRMKTLPKIRKLN